MDGTDRIGEEVCDLCGHEGAIFLADAQPTRNRTVVCPRCRLIYGWPRPSVDELERHYREDFRGDRGSNASIQVNGGPDIPLEDQRAASWSLKVVRQAVDIRGKRVLDLRSRTGSLALAMEELGATVTPVDPFPFNIKSARQRGLDRATCLPISQFHRTPFEDASFDVVTALTEHVPGHAVAARQLFDEWHRLLRPQGYLLLDEKDVLRPTRFKKPTLLDTGPAHLYHFTPTTLRMYLRLAGFDVFQCEIDARRKSAFRHIRVVAKKPSRTPVPGADLADWSVGPSVPEIRRKIWWSQQRYRLRQFRHRVTGRRRKSAA